MPNIGEFEQLVMLSILRLGPDAHALGIRAELQEGAGRSVSRGALYTTLERLEKKGLVGWEVSDSTPERGGLPRRRFSLLPEGLQAVRTARDTLLHFWSGIEEFRG